MGMGLNRKLFFSIYNFTKRNKIAKALGIFTAKYSQKLFILIYLAGIIIVYQVNFGAIIKFMAIPFITLLYNSFLRHRLNMPRPFVKEGIEPLVTHEASGSCPSNHGVSSMIIALAFFAVNGYAACGLIILAVLTGLSRVMVGIHYPMDVLISWIIAWTIGIIGFIIL